MPFKGEKRMKPQNIATVQLSAEQSKFIEEARKGKNVLVDACIGSGKTTAIQLLCGEIPKEKQVLYLTYNKLLKLDAQQKIKGKNITVTNYHSFALSALKKQGIHAGISDLIQRFNKEKPPIQKYDVLILDEYQDVEEEFAELLNYIKTSNENLQIIAVGDMDQKIYDKTALDVKKFITDFLGDYVQLQFTQCFRLSAELGNMLGRIWKKQIVGVNKNCIVETMQLPNVLEYLSNQEPKDILCLGKREGDLSETLNLLEKNWPEKFNKNTVFASISDKNAMGTTSPKRDSAIFTTYDSSKGFERKICILFDFTEEYWALRLAMPQQKYEILRNIFCVAASRGKEKIIFVQSGKELLSEQSLLLNQENEDLERFFISDMFFFKYKEDVEECYQLLNIERMEEESSPELKIKNSDGLIDLSPCIGIFQEAAFFEKYDIDKQIEFALLNRGSKKIMFTEEVKKSSVKEKVLFLTALETHQDRYWLQVKKDFISEEEQIALCERLQTVFSKDEEVQKFGMIKFGRENGESWFSAIGIADVIKDNTVYELKYVTELMHEHFLQCACYMIAFGLKRGVLWNTRTNEKYHISVPDEKAFLNAVSKTITKRACAEYFKPPKDEENVPLSKMFAVIDTETNWNDEVMSVGLVIANENTLCAEYERYYIFSPEDTVGGMYSSKLEMRSCNPIRCTRKEALKEIKYILKCHNIERMFAYNASFDLRHLPELNFLSWYDIMKVAAYKQYNNKIPETAETYKTGRLKSNYGVEAIICLLKDDDKYTESHNALLDARDELEIMRLLGHGIEVYSCANIHEGKQNEEKGIIEEMVQLIQPGEGANEEQYDKEKNGIPENEKCTSDKQIKEVEKYYSVAEAARILNVSKSTVYKRLREGEISFIQRDGIYVVKETDLNKYIESIKNAQKVSMMMFYGLMVGSIIAFVILWLMMDNLI